MLRDIRRICPDPEEKPRPDLSSAFNAEAFFLQNQANLVDIIVRSYPGGFFLPPEVIAKLKSYPAESLAEGWHKNIKEIFKDEIAKDNYLELRLPIGLIKVKDQRKAASTASLYTVLPQLLGQGYFGRVHCGQNIESGELVAIKVQSVLLDSKFEIGMLLKKNLLIASGNVQGAGFLPDAYIISPYVSHQALNRAIHYTPFSIGAMRFSEIIIKIGIEIQKLHRLGCLHNDLNSSNMRTDLNIYNEKIEIIDFGVSSYTHDGTPINSRTQLKSNGCAIKNFPPEFPHSRGPFTVTEATDVYHFGLLVRDMMRADSIFLKRSTDMYTRLDALLNLMTDKNPLNRPTLDLCMATLHAIFVGISPVSKSIDTSQLEPYLKIIDEDPFTPAEGIERIVPQLTGADFVNVTDKMQLSTPTTQAKIHKLLLRAGLRIASQPFINPTHTEEMRDSGTKLFSRYPRWGMEKEVFVPEVVLESVENTFSNALKTCCLHAALKVNGKPIKYEVEESHSIAELKTWIGSALLPVITGRITIKATRGGTTFELEDDVTMRQFMFKYQEREAPLALKVRPA